MGSLRLNWRSASAPKLAPLSSGTYLRYTLGEVILVVRLAFLEENLHMIDTFTLKVVFYGLVAFVPNKDAAPDALSVLMLDGEGVQYSSDGCMLHEHFPVLHVSAEKCTVQTLPLPQSRLAQGQGPKSSLKEEAPAQAPIPCPVSPLEELPRDIRIPNDVFGVKGSWSLRDKIIFVSFDPGEGDRGIKLVTDRRVRGERLPGNRFEATDFSWVPRVSLGEEIDVACLRSTPGPNCPIAAHAVIANASLQTCHLTEIVGSNGSTGYICSYDFRPLTKPEPRGDDLQAVADVVMATATLPDSTKIWLTMRDLKSGVDQRIELYAGTLDSVEIWIINEVPRTPHGTHEECNVKSIDRHFELYYNLSERPNGRPFPLAERPVPQASIECKKSAGLQPQGVDGCRILTYKRLDEEGRELGPVPGDKPACGTRLFAPNSMAGLPEELR